MATPIKLMRTLPTVNVTEVTNVGTLPAEDTATFTTAALDTLSGTYSSDNTESGSIELAKMFTILNITLNAAGRIRLYRTAATRDADLTRLNIPPTPGTDHGVIADWYLDGVTWTLDWFCDPPVVGYNGDSTQTTAIYYNVTNISGSSQAVSVTLTFVPMES